MARTEDKPDAEMIRAYLDSAVSTAETAGQIALQYFRNPIAVEDKSKGVAFDPVTRADREVEAAIRADLMRLYPDHGIMGEEEEAVESDSPYCWVIDPIDGTRAFISGVPAWGVLLGLTWNGSCLAGVMHQPYLGETFSGRAGEALLRRDKNLLTLRTSETQSIESAITYCTHPSMFETSEARQCFNRVAKQSRMMRYGGDCYSYCLLAHGMVDLVIEGQLQPYDIIPLIPIIEGAGGVVTNWQGESATAGGLVVAAANPTLHARALEVLNP